MRPKGKRAADNDHYLTRTGPAFCSAFELVSRDVSSATSHRGTRYDYVPAIERANLTMATERNRILAVIDPTRSDQWALQKALAIAKDRDDSDIYAFLCVYSDANCTDRQQLQSVELSRHKLWLEEIVAASSYAGIEIEPIVEWGDNWRNAVCLAAKHAEINLVIKTASGRQKSLASSDRQLIRTLQCGLLIVKHAPAEELRNVLVAVDFNSVDDTHVALNNSIMALGQRIRGTGTKITLHSISAYPGPDQFVHPPDVAKLLDIDRSHARVYMGDAAEAIPEAASKIKADLVIVGNVGRTGLSGMSIGNTAEKILTDVESDVLVLVKRDE